MSNICSFSMANTHNNVEFGVLQKTYKQSLISIFFKIREGGNHPPIPTPRSALRPSIKGFALVYTNSTPTHNFLDPPPVLDFLSSPVPDRFTSKVAGLGRDSLIYYGGAISLFWSVACVNRPHSPN